ncbi:RNA polymerase sigma factor [Stieleria varia]|nr:sigma factor-like helix-turn-helix DNA-binding protein [Stieleria varia]
MNSPDQSPRDHDELEPWIFQRIEQLCSENDDALASDRDPELEDAIYRFLYRELRRVAAVLPGLGPKALDRNADHSARFTAVLNKAFLRILERYPDRLLRAKARNQLTGYVSKTMSSMMLNHYARKERYQKVLQDVVQDLPMHDQEGDQLIAGLTEDRGAYFQNRTGIEFAIGLRVLKQWDESDDLEERSRAMVMRFRYVDGFGYAEIAERLSITKQNVERLLERAKYHLKRAQP